MRLEAMLASLLLLTAAFAGCLGGDDDLDSQSTDIAIDDPTGTVDAGTDAAEGAAEAGQAAVAQAFAFDGENMHVPVEETGSFSAADTCYLGGCFTGNAFDEVDLGSKAPAGVPVHVMLTLDYSSEGGSADMWLSGDGATFYTYDYEYDGEADIVQISAMVGLESADDLVANIGGYFPGDGGNVEWNLTGTVMTHATVVPQHVPVALDVPEGTNGFHLGGAHGARATANAMVWGPDDTFLGTFTGDQGVPVDLGENATPGEYVVLLRSFEAEPGPNAEEHAKHLAKMGLELHPLGLPEEGAELPALRMLDLEVSMGELQQVDPGSTVEWTVEHPTAPVASGLMVHAPGPAGVNNLIVKDAFEGTLSSPAGTLVDEADSGYVLYLGELMYALGSGTAHENLVPGTYDASFTLHESTPVEVATYTLSFVR